MEGDVAMAETAKPEVTASNPPVSPTATVASLTPAAPVITAAEASELSEPAILKKEGEAERSGGDVTAEANAKLEV